MRMYRRWKKSKAKKGVHTCEIGTIVWSRGRKSYGPGDYTFFEIGSNVKHGPFRTWDEVKAYTDEKFPFSSDVISFDQEVMKRQFGG